MISRHPIGLKPNVTIIDLGSGQDNTVTSPGYPYSYPKGMECVYSISVPRGMAMKLNIYDLDIPTHRESCKYVAAEHSLDLERVAIRVRLFHFYLVTFTEPSMLLNNKTENVRHEIEVKHDNPKNKH